METVKIGNIRVSRFILGSNPFSGFSHQGPQMDQEMIHYWTYARIKEALRQAESLGINAVVARADLHMLRMLVEYWDEGGKVRWIGQTCPGVGPPEMCLKRMADAGALACHIHGGYADRLLAEGRAGQLVPDVECGRKLGLTMGLAGHNPDTFRWAEQNLDVDYYMCSYYADIKQNKQDERRAMTELIQTLSKPVIHYKVMGAGRNDPAEAFACVAKSMRPTDAVCVGVYTRHKPNMLQEDVELFERSLSLRRSR